MTAGWTIRHGLAVAAALTVCGLVFLYTGDSDLFQILSMAMGLGFLAWAGLQIRSWFRDP